MGIKPLFIDETVFYGVGKASADIAAGQVLKIADSNEFAPNTDGSYPVGFAAESRSAGETCTVLMGGVFETDVFNGDPQPGNMLAVDTDGKLKVAGADEDVVGVVLARSGDKIVFKSLI
ncbi:MAG TPA: DUF2190 family protein [Proteobacteria bacterium]|nr:DUF2190 family protein [Pseudomonadota bacterium]